MKKLDQHLIKYALYHRDERNILTHFVGVPLIVFAVMGLLYFPLMSVNSLLFTPALLIAILAILFYLALDIKLGLLMSGLYLLGLWGVDSIFESMSTQTASFYGLFAGLFVVGWIIQFIGHYYEGKKPAFVDDLIGLLVGPLFVVVELLFKLGLLKSLEARIIEHAGPYRN
ncbi:hypothetical protein C1E24_12830 [Pseudoalteromonas phenolica]|uniref:DUF962 domain-containing protein n=1 Tax=Pseudoalteromonas phenolica TaxID=161398 RepID=A0A5R9Q064_9GAMM|nr:Mpo1-like protein [Pseudoalteromonas phenolica]TLX46548.1 hypothetical protein C1E24_12830 [Pseudoalteromonas phenolica]